MHSYVLYNVFNLGGLEGGVGSFLRERPKIGRQEMQKKECGLYCIMCKQNERHCFGGPAGGVAWFGGGGGRGLQRGEEVVIVLLLQMLSAKEYRDKLPWPSPGSLPKQDQ